MNKELSDKEKMADMTIHNNTCNKCFKEWMDFMNGRKK